MRLKLVMLVFLGCLCSFGQSITLSVLNQGPIRAGNTLQLQALLAGSSAATMAAFQISLRATIPGTWAVQPAAVATAAGKTFSCAAPDINSPDYRCVVGGVNANVIADGVVATITLAIPASAPAGQVSILPSNVLGASADGSVMATTAVPLSFTLASPLSSCDLNSDGFTNVQDVQLAIAQVLGLAPSTLDLDQDGKTTIADYQRVVNASIGAACKVGK